MLNQQTQMCMLKLEALMGMPKQIMMIKDKIRLLQSLEEFLRLVKPRWLQLMLSQVLMKELFGKQSFIKKQKMKRSKRKKTKKELRLSKHNRSNLQNKTMIK